MSKLPMILLAFILPNISVVQARDIIPIDPNDPTPSLPSIPPPSSSSSSFSSITSSITSSSTSKPPSSSPSSSSASPESDYIATSGIYGPFQFGDPDYYITFQYRYYFQSQYIKERLRLSNNDGQVYSSTQKLHDYNSGTLQNVTFKVPISNLMNTHGLSMIFEIYDSTSTPLKSYPITEFYFPQSQFINFQTLRNELYSSKNFAFYADGNSIVAINERLDFTSFSDYLDVDYYYRLNLSNLRFSYDSLVPFNYESATLRFVDKERLFPYLSHDYNHEVKLPVSLKSNGSVISFAFKDKYYINKRTLQISETFKPDYALTGDFYLPINGKKIFNHKTLFLDINGVGVNRISTSIPLSYDADKDLMGLCHDAVHCLVGGMN